MTIYGQLGVRTVVNARGCATLAGGTLMEPEVVAAMAEAARSFARIGDLQETASARIAALTGAEAGYVTAGAAAALTLGSAAMLAGLDPDRMDRLPDTGDGPSEIIVQASHRNPYDHLVRASGARLVEITTAEEMAAAIGPATAGAFFHGQAEADGLPIETFVALAHARGLPVLVDASMNLPPRGEPAAVHRRRRGPRGVQRRQDDPRPTGLGVPRRTQGPAGLRRPAAAGHGRHPRDVGPPRTARGGGARPAAPARDRARHEDRQGGDRRAARGAERYAARDEVAETARWASLTDRLAAGLAGIPGLTVRTEPTQADGRPVPMTIVHVDASAFELSAVELTRRFAARDPIIMLGDHDAEAGVLRLDPENLDAAGVDAIVEAFRTGGA